MDRAGYGTQVGTSERVEAATAIRRPLTRLGIGGLAAHVTFEFGAGVGVPLASIIGPIPAAALWGAATAVASRSARRSSRDHAFVLINGFGLAAVSAHMLGWPTRRTCLGLPWLRDCEGLGPGSMRYYNPILYVSFAACAAALLRENGSAPRRWALLSIALAPVVMRWQHLEHRRLRQIAAHRPAWWNRRLRP
jgi:hypothetical protein